MNRADLLEQARARQQAYDLVVIGGGATGAGVALDGATRGLDVLLLEAQDFGSGTSSRSSKLAHGGVRYLAQGRIGLVREALHERARMLKNAPHLVSVLPILVPAANRIELAKFWIGLKLYDWLSGTASFGASHYLSRAALAQRMPAVAGAGLSGAVAYYDGQFDDARYILALLKTAANAGAIPLNYCAVTALNKDADGNISGVTVHDTHSDVTFEVEARVVINATGPFADTVIRLDDPNAHSVIVPSQGVHVVVEQRFLPGNDALLIPETPDGRIMFALPWHDHVLLGTTDTLLPETPRQPVAQADEIAMILEVAARYLQPAPTHRDILAVFAGVRPLTRTSNAATAKLSRKHAINVSASGLISITGGKWTTYRKMAEDCVDRAIAEHHLQSGPCQTATLALHGAGVEIAELDSLAIYGSDAPRIRALCEQHAELAKPLHPDLPYLAAECVWAAREEMAITVEDVLARRTRALFLNTKAAVDCAPRVAALLSQELAQDDRWQQQQLDAFGRAAGGYQPPEEMRL